MTTGYEAQSRCIPVNDNVVLTIIKISSKKIRGSRINMYVQVPFFFLLAVCIHEIKLNQSKLAALCAYYYLCRIEEVQSSPPIVQHLPYILLVCRMKPPSWILAKIVVLIIPWIKTGDENVFRTSPPKDNLLVLRNTKLPIVLASVSR